MKKLPWAISSVCLKGDKSMDIEGGGSPLVCELLMFYNLIWYFSKANPQPHAHATFTASVINV